VPAGIDFVWVKRKEFLTKGFWKEGMIKLAALQWNTIAKVSTPMYVKHLFKVYFEGFSALQSDPW
jgi:hypothetical protein